MNPTNAKLDPRVKQLWLEALRSGDYVQGRGQLAHIDASGRRVSHCCLGVLCELAVKDGVVEDFAEQHGAPTATVQRWAAVGERERFGGFSWLVDRNDGAHGRAQTFKQIANLIERHM